MALRVTSKSVDDGVVTLDVLYKLALLPAERASEAIGIKGSTFKKRCALRARNARGGFGTRRSRYALMTDERYARDVD